MKKYYNEGWNAFSNSVFYKDNPYHNQSDEYFAWCNGWNDHYNDLNKYISVL